MDARAVAGLRRRLHLTQSGLARILGVHAMTVSKWERGLLRPTRHQQDILQAVARGDAPAGAARELADFLNHSLIDVSELEGMKLSASNQLRGKIVQLEEGPISARIVIEIAPGVHIVSVITTASVRRLGLRPGKRVVAIIKATEVIVGCK